MRGRIKEEYRLPLVMMLQRTRETCEATLKTCGLLE